MSTFIKNVFAHSNGLVLSESIQSVASKRLLLLNMPLLAQQRVEVIYIEHLFTDKHLNKLAKYKAQGSRIRAGSHEIKDHLEHLNNGALSNHNREYDYYHLIKQAHRHNIEVRPFSSSVSYPMLEHPVTIAAEDSAAAQKMSNFFGHKIISEDVAADPARRWVALLDHKLATTHDDVPGIAELQGAISVEIKDVPSGRVTRIRPKPEPTAANTQMSTCDFKIEFANPDLAGPPVVAAKPTQLDDALLQKWTAHPWAARTQATTDLFGTPRRAGSGSIPKTGCPKARLLRFSNPSPIPRTRCQQMPGQRCINWPTSSARV